MKLSGIYLITNLVNRKRYVGQAVEFKVRWRNHKTKLRGKRHENEHLQRSWSKYGEDAFLFEVLEECPIESLDEREIYWINHFNFHLDAKLGYNKEKPTIGGRKVLSDETLRKMSESHKGQRAWNKGMKGTTPCNEKPFSLRSPTGEIISGVNLKAFCRENGLSYGCMRHVFTGKQKFHKGWSKG